MANHNEEARGAAAHTHAEGEAHSHGYEHTHDHSHETGHDHDHEAGHAHGGHSHVHSPEHNKKVLNRLSRAIGHMESIKRMVEEDRDCSEVLIQLAAVRAAINNLGKLVLKDHIETCVVDAVQHGDEDRLKDLQVAIDRFMK